MIASHRECTRVSGATAITVLKKLCAHVSSLHIVLYEGLKALLQSLPSAVSLRSALQVSAFLASRCLPFSVLLRYTLLMASRVTMSSAAAARQTSLLFANSRLVGQNAHGLRFASAHTLKKVTHVGYGGVSPMALKPKTRLGGVPPPPEGPVPSRMTQVKAGPLVFYFLGFSLITGTIYWLLPNDYLTRISSFLIGATPPSTPAAVTVGSDSAQAAAQPSSTASTPAPTPQRLVAESQQAVAPADVAAASSPAPAVPVSVPATVVAASPETQHGTESVAEPVKKKSAGWWGWLGW